MLQCISYDLKKLSVIYLFKLFSLEILSMINRDFTFLCGKNGIYCCVAAPWTPPPPLKKKFWGDSNNIFFIRNNMPDFSLCENMHNTAFYYRKKTGYLGQTTVTLWWIFYLLFTGNCGTAQFIQMLQNKTNKRTYFLPI